jgi:hypothetical protein
MLYDGWKPPLEPESEPEPEPETVCDFRIERWTDIAHCFTHNVDWQYRRGKRLCPIGEVLSREG